MADVHDYALLTSHARRLPQQGLESRLLEMMVSRKSLGETAFAHHDKRDAISQAPSLVWAAVKEPQSLIHKASRRRYRLNPWLLRNKLHDRLNQRAKRDAG